MHHSNSREDKTMNDTETKHDAEVKYLKDYKPSEFSVESLHITIDLRDDHALVTNEFKVAITTGKPNLIKLDGNDQELISVEMDGKALSKQQYQLTQDDISIPISKPTFKLRIQSKIKPVQNTSLLGLYETEGLFLTQCEPLGFRKITYFLDRPDIMTVYTTTLIADKKYPILLSNGDAIEKGNLDGNRHFVTWHDKSKKPSYLFAVVFGDLEVKKDSFKTMSGKKVALEIYTSAKDIKKTDYAMYSLKSAMKWDEEVFGREYDLNTYMIVGTNKFNAGAMENKGLNIFNTQYILADKDVATDMNYKAVHAVVGHEYFHNWTGNRITLRDWFHLSIKEGLTVFREHEFSSDEFDRPTQRIAEANLIKSIQFKEDSGPLSHPIRPESYVAMDNFYTTTVYQKGSEVIRMFKTILGDKAFRKAMDLYFERHDGQAVVAEDFIKAMEDAGHIDLTQFKRWYSQSGTPIVEAQGEYDRATQTYTLKCKQIYKPSPKQEGNQPFFIPIKTGLIGSKSGDALKFKYLNHERNEVVLHLTKEEQTFVFKNVVEEPLPSLLRDFSAPVKLVFPYTKGQLLWLMAHDSNEFNRWEAGQRYLLAEVLLFMDVMKAGGKPTCTPELIAAFKSTLNSKKLSREFIVKALVLPSERLVYEHLQEIDPRLVFTARKSLVEQLSAALKVDCLNVYNSLNKDLHTRPYALTKEDISARSLKNLCLGYLHYADEKLAEQLATEQLDKTDNLTDRLPAFALLVESKDPKIFTHVTTQFYDKWKHEDLIMDKWLAIQAGADRNDVVQILEKLLKHPAFDMKTPNKVYALLGSFAANNDKFHNPDGSGYKLYTDFIIKLDSINPKTASRLARSFDNWKKLEPQRRELVSKALAQIKAQGKLSNDLGEVINSMFL
jgi:aminopeptidase N